MYILNYSNFEQMCHSLRKPCFSTHFDWSRPCGSQDKLKPDLYHCKKKKHLGYHILVISVAYLLCK